MKTRNDLELLLKYEGTGEFEFNGYTIKIDFEPYPENPYDNWDFMGHWVQYKNSSYTMSRNMETIYCDNVTIFEYQLDYLKFDYSNFDQDNNYEERLRKTLAKIPHYTYYWEAGNCAGFVIMDKKDIELEKYGKIFTKKVKEKLENYFKAMEKTLNNWAEGEVYGFQVLDSEGEYVDSCWGFYGDHDGSSILDSIWESVQIPEIEYLEKNTLKEFADLVKIS